MGFNEKIFGLILFFVVGGASLWIPRVPKAAIAIPTSCVKPSQPSVAVLKVEPSLEKKTDPAITKPRELPRVSGGVSGFGVYTSVYDEEEEEYVEQF